MYILLQVCTAISVQVDYFHKVAVVLSNELRCESRLVLRSSYLSRDHSCYL